MNRRSFIASAAVSLLAAGRASAQNARPPAKLAFVRIVPPLKENVDAFEDGLREQGLRIGRDVVVEYRDAGGRPEALEPLLADLLARKVDVLLVSGSVVAQTARRLTSTTPIVLTAAGDPLALGLVPSLSRPGGNITGNSIVNVAVAGKRVELLRALLPRLTRVAVLYNRRNPALLPEWEATAAAGRELGVEMDLVEVNGVEGVDEALGKARQRGAQALVVLEDPTFNTERKRLVALATRLRLPAIYGQRAHVEVGGLMSYGPNFSRLYRNAAVFVDKILKGTKPADLPIEQPSVFELVLNLRAAQAIGLVVPSALQIRADVIVRD